MNRALNHVRTCILIFFSFSFSVSAVNIDSNSEFKKVTLDRWQFGTLDPTLAWGLPVEIDNKTFSVGKTSTITPYLRMIDDNIELGLAAKGGVYQYYCDNSLLAENELDLYEVQDSHVKFATKCIVGDRLLIYPSTPFGVSYFIEAMLSNQDVNIQHYWSGTQWQVSSLGFNHILKIMTAWKNVLEKSI